MFRLDAPYRPRLRLSQAVLLLALCPACSTTDEQPFEDPAIADAPRIADPSQPCVQYCEARASTFMERCELQADDTVNCEQEWGAAFDACVASQCSLTVHVPDPAGLQQLAVALGPELLGPDFTLVSEQPHHWDEDTIGSRVYGFVSSEDGSPAFIELGASLDQPPVVSYGFGPTAADARSEHAIERLSENYGALGYTLVRRYFSAAHPILEFQTPQGDSYFYSVANDDVSHVFAIEDDPEADPMELAVRREGFIREWSRHVQ